MKIKYKIKLMLFFLIVIVLVFGINLTNKGTVENRVFYLGNNEDFTYSKMLYAITANRDTETKPFEENIIEILGNDLNIKNIVPTYPIKINSDKYGTLKVDLFYDEKRKTAEKPVEILELESGEIVEYSYSINVLTYADEDSFLVDNHVSKKYKSESGIYVTQTFFDLFGLSSYAEELSLKATLSIPQEVISKKDIISFPYDPSLKTWTKSETVNINRDFYITNSYEYMDVEFDIEGIVPLYQEYDGISIVISEKTLNEIIEALPSNKWKPSEYAIVVDKNMNIDELGAILSKYISDFVLIDNVNDERKIFE